MKKLITKLIGEPIWIQSHWGSVVKSRLKHTSSGPIAYCGLKGKAWYAVSIFVSWAKIEGYLVMFYHPTSRMVDWQMIETWIDENFQGKWDSGTRKAETDAQNFHHCVDAINERKKLDGAK